MMEQASLLSVRGLGKKFGGFKALNGFDLDIGVGERIGVIGPNGAGKSTLLNVVARSHRLKTGTVTVLGANSAAFSQAAVVKHGCVLVPEGRQVFSSLSVRDNLILGGYTDRRAGNTKPLMSTVFEIFPRLEERADQFSGTLSGGEQQMLAIGRAIMSQPRVMLLDEPSLGLAPQMTMRIMAVLAQLREERGLTIVLVEQNAHAALDLADRGYLLSGGEVVLEGSSAALRADKTIQHVYLGASPHTEK